MATNLEGCSCLAAYQMYRAALKNTRTAVTPARASERDVPATPRPPFKMPTDSFDHIEELNLEAPHDGCWFSSFSCCLATVSDRSGRKKAGEEWNRALSLIPIKDKPTKKLFQRRVCVASLVYWRLRLSHVLS